MNFFYASSLFILLMMGASSAFAATNYASKTSGTISIAPDDNLIVATTITNWDPKASDDLIVRWIAPKGSFCKSSIFEVVPGNNTNHDVSWSYRTVVHTTDSGKTIVCSGKWAAVLINRATHTILASSGYTVGADSAPSTQSTPFASSPAIPETTPVQPSHS